MSRKAGSKVLGSGSRGFKIHKGLGLRVVQGSVLDVFDIGKQKRV